MQLNATTQPRTQQHAQPKKQEEGACMWMAEISVDLIQMVSYHADSCAISSLAFFLLYFNTHCIIELRDTFEFDEIPNFSWLTEQAGKLRYMI